MAKITVRIYLSGHYTVPVNANTEDEAVERAREAFVYSDTFKDTLEYLDYEILENDLENSMEDTK